MVDKEYWKYKRKKGVCVKCRKAKRIHSRGLCSYCYNKYLMAVNPEFKERVRKNNQKYQFRHQKRIEYYGMSSEEYDIFRIKCWLCGFDKYLVDIHHIDRNKENNTKENLIAVCPNCHRGIHYGIIQLNKQGGKNGDTS